MKKKILVVYPVPKEGLAELEKEFDVVYPENGCAFDHEELFHKVVDCDAILSVFNVPVSPTLIKAGKRLKIISNYGVGFNNVDVDAAKAANIVVANTPDPVAAPTAELAISLIVSLLRKVTYFDQKLRTRKYKNWDMLHNMGTTLQGKVLGIVGMGSIGKHVTRLAQAFGMKVIYCKRTRLSKAEEKKIGVTYVPFADLLKQADVVSLHTPLTPETKHLIGKEELASMKNTSFIINTARGAVIHEVALVEALRNGTIAGAALDVFEDEPHITEGLLDLPNIIAVPHIGTQTLEARIAMAQQASANIISFFKGEEVVNRVG